MICDASDLRHVPLFSLLDEDELCVLAGQVEIRHFAARQRIYKLGDMGNCAYILLEGAAQVSVVDEDAQQVVIHEPQHGEFFGFASMLDQVPHQTSAIAIEDSKCLEIDRHDIATLIEKKPMAGLDMMTVLARQFHAAQHLVKTRAMKNPNLVIDEKETTGEHIADRVASFGGSWTFIILFGFILVIYAGINIVLKGRAWDPYPFILLNLFLSTLAAIQAPVIKKDRLRSELDFNVNVRSESEIQALSRRMKELRDKLDDFDDLMRIR
jgi:CRP/FNR family cyclic AMP-dependent transcriptional regulator